MLEEYCYENFDALEGILGPVIVQRGKQAIDSRLFEPDRHTDLVQAILSAFDGITATRQAVEAERLDESAEPDDREEESDQEAAQ